MAELKPCPFCGKHLIKKSNHNRLRVRDLMEEKKKMTEITKEIEQAIAKIGEELGAEMIVHCSVSVGAKKEIGGKTFGDSVILPDILDEDEDWRTTLDRFKTRMKIWYQSIMVLYLESKQDEERRKDGG